MLTKELIDSLNLGHDTNESTDPEQVAKQLSLLETVIEQINNVEQEYINLNSSYEKLQGLITEIVECLPVALWVIESDGSLFLQNSEATKIHHILELVTLQQPAEEIELEGSTYLIRLSRHAEKTIISATDITEEKRKERLASMGQVAAHLAHEIRNPIGSVALLAGSLLKKADIKTKPIVFEIKKSIWRVERIVKATLLFSKGLQPNMQRFSLTSLEDELELALTHYTYSKEINFRFDFPDSPITADHDLLTIVLQNFLFNAIDAIEENDEDGEEEGLVEFQYHRTEDVHHFRIYDNGKPIDNKAMLFEPFKSTKTKGHGLGLALSMQIIAAHEGEIRLLPGDKKGFEITLKDPAA